MGGKGSSTLFHVRGLPVRVHYTFLIILPYLAWVIGRSAPLLAQLAGVDVAELVLPRYVLGTVLAFGLFGCVLIHEFAHIGVGLKGGGQFSGVTLMIVGGVSEVVELPKRPIWELAMAIAGPLASVVLAMVGFVAYGLFPMPPDVQFGVFYLAYVNFALALFNLIPAFPMDGGRILRSVLSMLTNRVRATRIAAVTGQIFAGLFLLAGIYTLNWVLLLIGALVIVGARAELEMAKVGALFDGLTVEQAMQPFVPTVDENERVSAVLERMVRELKTTFFITRDGKIVGAITAVDARRLDERGEGTLRVGEAGEREVPVLSPNQELGKASRLLRTSGLSALPVMRDGELVGQLTLAAMAVAVRERDAHKLVSLRDRKAT
ncbi:MAG: site-2 protease family protein [Myxococcales bacterium]|jgi:Zn-dependent protease